MQKFVLTKCFKWNFSAQKFKYYFNGNMRYVYLFCYSSKIFNLKFEYYITLITLIIESRFTKVLNQDCGIFLSLWPKRILSSVKYAPFIFPLSKSCLTSDVNDFLFCHCTYFWKAERQSRFDKYSSGLWNCSAQNLWRFCWSTQVQEMYEWPILNQRWRLMWFPQQRKDKYKRWTCWLNRKNKFTVIFRPFLKFTLLLAFQNISGSWNFWNFWKSFADPRFF